jgi:peptidoglycan/xylan/chitin deacetylase (PgdA/CDA1 family)
MPPEGGPSPPIPSQPWLVLWFLLAALLIGSGFWLVIHREPAYGGKKLSAWVDDLKRNPAAPPEKRIAAEEAIRQMGTASLPYLVDFIRNDPPRISLELNQWLKKQSRIKYRFPIRPNRSDQAIEAFQNLGPAARPALRGLAPLTERELTCYAATKCLIAIGSPAVPVFTNALARTNRLIKITAMMGLGEVSPAAKEAIPLLVMKAHDPDRPVAEWAIRALGQMTSDKKPVLPLLTPTTSDTNLTRDLAFVLALLGPEGVPYLVPQLTNESKIVRLAAIAALDPEVQRISGERLRNGQDPVPPVLGMMFIQKTVRADWRFQMGAGTGLVVSILAANFAHTNAQVRAEIAGLLGNYGFRAAAATPLLSNALADVDANVRRNAAAALGKMPGEFHEGGIIRGPKDQKIIALEFTGHEFAEGGEVILDELARHQAKASFFLTGDFLANPEFEPLIRRIIREGHYLGPHSDKHLLYCPWEGPKNTLVTRPQFTSDLENNLKQIQRFGVPRAQIQYWLPAYEWYNQEIVDWSAQMGLTLVNYSPGTRSNADYLEESAKNFISSQTILESILKKEQEGPTGLNGFLLLLHIGTGPARTDKMHRHLGKLLDDLSGKGYRFVRIDELLQSK